MTTQKLKIQKLILPTAIVLLCILASFYFWSSTPEKVEQAEEKEEVPTTVSVLSSQPTEKKDAEISEKGRRVKVHYELFIADGTSKGAKIESSRDINRPYEFLLGSGQVFPGWDKAIRYMKEGSRQKVFIPPEDGYGKEGLKGKVPPDTALILDVEVLAIDAR